MDILLRAIGAEHEGRPEAHEASGLSMQTVDALNDSEGDVSQVDTSLTPDASTDDNTRTSGRDAAGRFIAGNAESLTHGARRYELRGALPDDVRAALDAFRSDLESDRGGRSEMGAIESGYVRRLTQLEGVLELLGQDVATHGVMTQRGRPRAAYRAFLDTLATWDRLAQRLGLERKARRVSETFEAAIAREPEAR